MEPKKPRIANREASMYARDKREFRANNIFAQWVGYRMGEGERYVVYSYGTHWPLYIFDPVTNCWYGNSSKYSATTSKHAGQANPHADNMIPLHVDDMIKVAAGGITQII